MNNISFLGGSGYICSSIKNYDFGINKKIIFYSRRKTDKCIKYTNISEISKSDILFDLSQWANGEDIDEMGISEMKNLIRQSISKAKIYVFFSTLSIDINKNLNYPLGEYSLAKLNFEKMILDYDNTFVLRLPTCFHKNPKEGTLLDLLLSRLNGSKERIKEPMKFTSGITTKELFDFLKILVHNNEKISDTFGESRILRIGDGYAYKISKLEEFIENQIGKNSKFDEQLIFPEEDKINLIKNNNWHLQSVSFPIRILQTFHESIKK